MKRLHIGMICDEYPPLPHGGIGSVVCDLAEGLVDRDHIVTVVGSYSAEALANHPNTEEYRNNVRVIRLRDPKPWLRFRPRNIARCLMLRAWLEMEHQHNPFDIVEAPDYAGLMPWGISCAPGVVRLHGSNKFFDSELRRPSEPFEHLMEKQTIQSADFIFSVSRYAAEKTLQLMDMPNAPYKLLYNAVDTRVFCPSPAVQTVPGRIVFVNSLSPKKGIEDLCRAVNIVFAKVPHAHLVIVGRAVRVLSHGRPYHEHLLELVKPEFRDRVQFTGPLDRQTGVVEQLRRAQVSCLPSHLETFGIAAAEAMAVGKPVVFSETGPGPEIIRDGIDGLLCDPTNHEDIAAKLLLLLEDPDLCRSLGAAARRHVLDKLDRDAWIERNISCYEECLERYHHKKKA
jgi:glycosyltransferase involved in cell wall biosynthesis